MTALGPYAPPVNEAKARNRRRLVQIGSYIWAFAPLLTCGYAAPIMFGMALAKRRDTLTLAALIVHSALIIVGCAAVFGSGDPIPTWSIATFGTTMALAGFGSTAHLLVIRPVVWTPPSRPQVPVARLSSMEVVDRARKLREQARRTAEADPMLAKRLCIGRPDLPRQFDDGGLVDVNHAPLHVLVSLPGVTERSARQIQSWVEQSGPFGSLGEVMLVIEISPTFEHHLREYCVFIP
jgi:hypothetical protein